MKNPLFTPQEKLFILLRATGMSLAHIAALMDMEEKKINDFKKALHEKVRQHSGQVFVNGPFVQAYALSIGEITAAEISATLTAYLPGLKGFP